MALNFSATTHKVVVAADASINNFTAFTVLKWIDITTISNAKRFFEKGAVDNAKEAIVYDLGNSNSIEFKVDRVTTQALARPVDDVITEGAWYFIAFTYDESDGPRVFIGTREARITEPSYDIRTVGVGATLDDDGGDFGIANIPVVDVGLSCKIAFLSYYNRRMALSEIQTQQFRPRKTSGCRMFFHLGFNGTGTQPDWSGYGNSGTVTGAAVSPHVPLAPIFGFDVGLPYAVEAAARRIFITHV